MSNKELSYRGDIIINLIDEFPHASTYALARMAMEKHPLDFTNFGQARSQVRFRRGEHHRKPKSGTSAVIRTNQEKKEAMASFNLPESDYSPISEFVIPTGNNRGLIMNDIHIPYQDNQALETAMNYGLQFKPNFVYLNGDTIDMYQASRFIKDRRLRDIAGELEMTREFLKELRGAFDCPVYFKLGNHEERWENYMRLVAPELLGIGDFELKNILRFGELGVQEVKGKQLTKIGNFSLLHGHEFGHSVFSPVNAARGLYTRAKTSCAVGHHHQTSEHSEKDLNGEVVTTYSIGALCGLSPEYVPFNKWNHGFATIETDTTGDYEFRNLRIVEGKVR